MLNDFVLPGLVIGVGAALSPGPLLLMITAETLRGGVRRGLLMTLAPLFSDVPLALVSIVLAEAIAPFRSLVGLLSLLGAMFLLVLAYQNITMRRESLSRNASLTTSFMKAVILNILNPYLYVLWFSVAIPVFARGNLAGSLVFTVVLNASAVASMMLLVLLVGFLRVRFMDYVHWGIRALGVLLFLVALTFLRQGMLLL
jgi:threonine/homoserine/homoserine lactone efflux protein